MGVYQLRLGVLGVPLIMVPDSEPVFILNDMEEHEMWVEF
jgi:hypothetical protein